LALPAVSVADWLVQKRIATVGNRQHPDHET